MFRQIIEGVITMLSEQAKAKGVGLAGLMYNEIPAAVLGDPVRLRQVLAQLIGNAVKFTSRGEVIVRVNEAKTDRDPGIAEFPDHRIRASASRGSSEASVEAFRQGDGSRTRRFGGTGLGLAISKRIVELMGGEIGFDSAEGQVPPSGAPFPLISGMSMAPRLQCPRSPGREPGR